MTNALRRDIWNRGFRPVVLPDKEELMRQANRYRLSVRMALGRIRTK